MKRTPASGPERTFVPARSCIAPAGATGCPPPRMSSALGWAQGSPFISLRRAPAAPGHERRRPSPREQPSRVGSGRWGALRSEIKEERRAQPDSGDIRGAERPAVLISRNLSYASANVRNGPAGDGDKGVGFTSGGTRQGKQRLYIYTAIVGACARIRPGVFRRNLACRGGRSLQSDVRSARAVHPCEVKAGQRLGPHGRNREQAGQDRGHKPGHRRRIQIRQRSAVSPGTVNGST